MLLSYITDEPKILKWFRLDSTTQIRHLDMLWKQFSIYHFQEGKTGWMTSIYMLMIYQYPLQISDHQALVFLFQCRLKNVRLTRWTLTLQQFDLRVQYILGPDNIVDSLSRNSIGRNDENIINDNPCILHLKIFCVINIISLKYLNQF